ncbi:hypothetical protein FNF29_05658 [Cafeteria roenbergensis]|uniref:LNS2/PITP domain-containing protein n=1 Tax=Cafeteria roenbergensis TaxID=33653 RepID=A0A5A8C9P5_CAFRO|nr:hypothetical protein FNF29_05658 [Cafeteria roenbergensis]|eukprot:KAA0149833.1 hypothetical protein FNF29_05658 [Cafeteria roenbergensis]
MYATIRVIGGLIARTWDSSVNPATLTGALDIVAVQHDDGHIECTPFHIRFGRNDAYHANGEAVTMSVNGKRVHVVIKLGPAGEARFVRNVYKEYADGEGSLLGDTSSLPSAARQHSGDDASSVASADGGSVMTAPDLLPDGGAMAHARSATLGDTAGDSVRADLFPGGSPRRRDQLSAEGDNHAAASAIDREIAAAAADSGSSATGDAAGRADAGDSHSADSDAAGVDKGSPEWNSRRSDGQTRRGSTGECSTEDDIDVGAVVDIVMDDLDEAAAAAALRRRGGSFHASPSRRDVGLRRETALARPSQGGAVLAGSRLRRETRLPGADAGRSGGQSGAAVNATAAADAGEAGTAQRASAPSASPSLPAQSLAAELQDAEAGSIDVLFAFLAGLGSVASERPLPNPSGVAAAGAGDAAPGAARAASSLAASSLGSGSTAAKPPSRHLVARGGLLRGAVAVGGSTPAGVSVAVRPAHEAQTGSTSSGPLQAGSLASASHASFSALSDATTSSSAAAELAAAAGAALRVQRTGLYADASAAGSRGALLGLDILASAPSAAFLDGSADRRHRAAALPRAPAALPPPSLDDPNGVAVLQLAAVPGVTSGPAEPPHVRVSPVRLLAAFKTAASLQAAWPALAPTALLCQPAPGFTVVVDRIWATLCGADWRAAPRHIVPTGDGRTPDMAAIAPQLANPSLRFFIAMRIDRADAADAPGNSVACALLTGWASASPYIMQASMAAAASAAPRTTLADGAAADPAASLLSPTLVGTSPWTFPAASHPSSAERDSAAFALPGAALASGAQTSPAPATTAAGAAAAPPSAASSSSFLGSLFGAIRGSSAPAEPDVQPQPAAGSAAAAGDSASVEPPSPRGISRAGPSLSPALSADGALPLFTRGSVSLPQSPERRAAPAHSVTGDASSAGSGGPGSVDRAAAAGFDGSLDRGAGLGRLGEGRPRGSSLDGGARGAAGEAAAAASAATAAARAASAASDLPRRHIEEHMLRPSSEELELMGLREGLNVLRFRVDSTGAFVECKLFLWRPSDKIVISDVDGTITKSDAMGHLMYWVGADWTQEGVASFYANIERNGYKLVYLTSRAIGQAGSTRAYLDGIAQSDAHAAAAAGAASKLPPGPVITSPDRLFDAFTREVIMRKPEEFKKQALSDIRRLFPAHVNPFFCGFGNRDTDRISYEAVGVPDNRIYIINPKGDILRMGKVEFHTYSKLNEIVDTMFPPFQSKPSTAGGGRTMASPLFQPSASPGMLPLASPSRLGAPPLTAVPGAAKSVTSEGSGATSEQLAAPSASVPSLRRFGEPEFTEPQFSEASYWRSDSRRRVIVDVVPTNGTRQPATRSGKPSSGKPAGSAAAGVATGGAPKRS